MFVLDCFLWLSLLIILLCFDWCAFCFLLFLCFVSRFVVDFENYCLFFYYFVILFFVGDICMF